MSKLGPAFRQIKAGFQAGYRAKSPHLSKAKISKTNFPWITNLKRNPFVKQGEREKDVFVKGLAKELKPAEIEVAKLKTEGQMRVFHERYPSLTEKVRAARKEGIEVIEIDTLLPEMQSAFLDYSNSAGVHAFWQPNSPIGRSIWSHLRPAVIKPLAECKTLEELMAFIHHSKKPALVISSAKYANPVAEAYFCHEYFHALQTKNGLFPEELFTNVSNTREQIVNQMIQMASHPLWDPNIIAQSSSKKIEKLYNDYCRKIADNLRSGMKEKEITKVKDFLQKEYELEEHVSASQMEMAEFLSKKHGQEDLALKEAIEQLSSNNSTLWTIFKSVAEML